MTDSAVMKVYRAGNFCYKRGYPRLARALSKLNRLIFGAEIPSTCELGKNVKLKHGGLGIVLHDNLEVGDNCTIYQHVTIGGREESGTPVIGSGVYIGAGACILGNVVISDNVKIGANAVVLHDLPEGVTAVGVPAKVVSV